MKKITLTLAALITAIVLNAQINTVALTSIYANKTINAPDFPTITLVLSKLAQDSAFDLTGIVNDFHKELYTNFSKSFPFEMYPEEEVLNNEAFIALGEESRTGISDFFSVSPEGYYYIPETGKLKDELVNIFGDKVDGIMFADLEYQLYKKAQVLGFGTAAVSAYVRIRIFDKEGKKIFKLRVYQTSDKTIKFALGGVAMEPEEILPLCAEATDKAFGRMAEKLPKSIKKMNKKTSK